MPSKPIKPHHRGGVAVEDQESPVPETTIPTDLSDFNQPTPSSDIVSPDLADAEPPLVQALASPLVRPAGMKTAAHFTGPLVSAPTGFVAGSAPLAYRVNVNYAQGTFTGTAQ